MAIDKIVTTVKDHYCMCCDELIAKGTKALFVAEKQPKYDVDDNQIGIEYFRAWYCYDENIKIEFEGELVPKLPACG